MEVGVKAKIIAIGNSQGIRIPKIMLDQLGFGAEVELTIEKDRLVVRSVAHPRLGWEDQFRTMAALGDDTLLDGDSVGLSSWDEEEWEW